MIAGGASGIATFMALRRGLTAGPSPGSIFSYLALTPPGDHVGVIAGVLVAAAVSFLVTAAILKVSARAPATTSGDLESHAERSRAMKAEGSAVLGGADGRLGGRVADASGRTPRSSSPATPGWAAAPWARAPSARGCSRPAGTTSRSSTPRSRRPRRRRPGRRPRGPRPPGEGGATGRRDRHHPELPRRPRPRHASATA